MCRAVACANDIQHQPAWNSGWPAGLDGGGQVVAAGVFLLAAYLAGSAGLIPVPGFVPGPVLDGLDLLWLLWQVG